MTALLENVRVASPCRASWAGMTGDDRVRFCGLCRKSVYNLSSMTRPEAEALILEKEGRLCARYYQRADGTILTDDCPIALRVVRRRFLRLWGMAAALAMFVVGGPIACGGVTVGELRRPEPEETKKADDDAKPKPVKPDDPRR